MRQIAILGGTSDPIHDGHSKPAEGAYSHFPLDAYQSMPVVAPPYKQDRKLAGYARRLRMTELATAPYEVFCVSDFETERRGLFYTNNTLALLRKTYPDCAFSLTLSADSFFQLGFWHTPTDICRDARLPVAVREYTGRHTSLHEHVEHPRTPFDAWVELIPAPLIDISSMYIHALPAAGKKNTAQCLPPAVHDYIRTEGLYRR